VVVLGGGLHVVCCRTFEDCEDGWSIVAQTRFCVLGFHLHGSDQDKSLFTTVTSTSTWDVKCFDDHLSKLLV
jgi:hypothetical protein